MRIAKFLTVGVLVIALFVVGFMLALRGCLSEFDERYALTPILYFEKNDTLRAVSLVKYAETTSYVQENGITTKSFDYHYFIQSNDAATGKKMASQPITGHAGVKHFPEEVLGAGNGQAWIFIDELMAFDAVTLQKVADSKLIAEKNPALKTMLPEESRFYHFNSDHKTISITAKNGAQWLLNTTTLIATAAEEHTPIEIAREQMAMLQKLNSLQSSHVSFNQMIINQDTGNKQWLGLYSKNELEKLNDIVTLDVAYGKDTRRQLFTSSYYKSAANADLINKTAVKNVSASSWFLDGGFLLNRQTAQTIRLSNPDDRLLIYKSEIGREATLILCRISLNGNIQWQFNTGLHTWIDWTCSSNRIFIAGNSKGSYNDRCSLFLSVSLDSATVNSYNYFSDSNKQ